MFNKIIALLLLSVALTAQTQKPIKIVIPFTPGGIVDTTNRVLHSALEKELGQQVNIETRPGAGGQIGLRYIAQNKTDDVLITINPLPVVYFSGLDNAYCETAPNDTLTVVPAGGTLSGPGVNGNIFIASIAGTGGPYTVSYMFADVNGCTNSMTQNVTVTAVPIVNLTSVPPNGSAYLGQLITFSADPVNFPDYLFFVDSNQIQNGPHYIYQDGTLQDGQIVYVMISENGCAAMDSIILDIYPIPNAFTPDGDCLL